MAFHLQQICRISARLLYDINNSHLLITIMLVIHLFTNRQCKIGCLAMEDTTLVDREQ